MSRQGTLAGIVAGLTSLLEEIKAADGDRLQIVGWRGQKAHDPPSAWINLTPVATTHERGGKLEDRLPLEIWITRRPEDCEDSELSALAELADVVLPVIDDACKPSAAHTRFGVDHVARVGFAFRNAAEAEGEGAPLNVPALQISIVARWSGTYC